MVKNLVTGILPRYRVSGVGAHGQRVEIKATNDGKVAVDAAVEALKLGYTSITLWNTIDGTEEKLGK